MARRGNSWVSRWVNRYSAGEAGKAEKHNCTSACIIEGKRSVPFGDSTRLLLQGATDQEVSEMTHRNQRIVRFLLPVAAFWALSATGRAQTSGDSSKFDITGIRLDISVDQAQTAIRAHDPSMKVQVLQSPSQIGKSTFTSGVAGLMGSPNGKSDGILIAFTETEGNKAYRITRVLTYDQSSPAPRDVLVQQMTEKYGKQHSGTAEGMFWGFGLDGKPANVCGGALIGNFVSVDQFSFPVGSVFHRDCGIALEVIIGSGTLTARIQEVLVDGQLEYKNLMNIKKVHDDAEAKRLQELQDKAKQKSPF
jgi:hypothetical protein